MPLHELRVQATHSMRSCSSLDSPAISSCEAVAGIVIGKQSSLEGKGFPLKAAAPRMAGAHRRGAQTSGPGRRQGSECGKLLFFRAEVPTQIYRLSQYAFVSKIIIQFF